MVTYSEPPVDTGMPRTPILALPPGPAVPLAWRPGISFRTSASERGLKSVTVSVSTLVTEMELFSLVLSPPAAVTTTADRVSTSAGAAAAASADQAKPGAAMVKAAPIAASETPEVIRILDMP